MHAASAHQSAAATCLLDRVPQPAVELTMRLVPRYTGEKWADIQLAVSMEDFDALQWWITQINGFDTGDVVLHAARTNRPRVLMWILKTAQRAGVIEYCWTHIIMEMVRWGDAETVRYLLEHSWKYDHRAIKLAWKLKRRDIVELLQEYHGQFTRGRYSEPSAFW